jgi:hypothetical protein
VTRAELDGPGVRLLNRGGVANPDVLLIERADGERLVVKDYAPRAALVRAALAPWLVRRELRLLERAEGIDGVPAPRGRIDAHAFAMEYLDGLPLRRRTHGARLASRFFDELQRILDALAERGLVYLDLRSPSNVLELADGRPALVDLASAFRLPLPGGLRRWLERRALAKLRRRFSGPAAPWADEAPLHTLKIGNTRISHREAGPLRDPVPVLCLHDLGLTSAVFGALLDTALQRARRVLAPDLPGFGDSRRDVETLEPGALAAPLEAWLDALRVRQVDVIGQGAGARIARGFRAGRVRSALELPAVAHREAATPAALRAALPDSLDAAARGEIERHLELLRPRTRELLGAQAREVAPEHPDPWAWLDSPERLWEGLGRT